MNLHDVSEDDVKNYKKMCVCHSYVSWIMSNYDEQETKMKRKWKRLCDEVGSKNKACTHISEDERKFPKKEELIIGRSTHYCAKKHIINGFYDYVDGNYVAFVKEIANGLSWNSRSTDDCEGFKTISYSVLDDL